MDRSDIAAVMELVPSLNDFGIGLFDGGRGLTVAERKTEMEANKQKLLNSSEDCTKTCHWLATQAKSATINTNHTSYDLARLAKPRIGDVSNGVFIAAAIHCGFAYKLVPPNAQFGISEQTLRDPNGDESTRLLQVSAKVGEIATPLQDRIQHPTPPLRPQRNEKIRWSGEVPPHKWTGFFTKVLSRVVLTRGVRLEVTLEVPANPEGLQAKADEVRSGLKELGLDGAVQIN